MNMNYDNVTAIYREAFRQHGDSVRSVLWPRDRQDQRFTALTRFIDRDEFTLLDYGCGLAHLKPFLDSRWRAVRYHGVDLVEEFIALDRAKYPDAAFDRIGDYHDARGEFDYVVLSGVFNILYADDEQHQRVVRETLRHLFSLCRVALAVNFMTDRVDFRQPGSYHQNPAEICTFVADELSPRLILDQSYMPYEFTVTALRDREIVRPDNVYRP